MAARITTRVARGRRESSCGNMAPRVGFAYRLTQDGKTSLRGGIGYSYSPPQASIYNPYTNIAPFAPTFTLNGVDFADPFGSQGIVNPFPDQYGPKVRGPEATFTLPPPSVPSSRKTSASRVCCSGT